MEVDGIGAGGRRDLAVTKVKSIENRGELPDQYDLMVIEQRIGLRADLALSDSLMRLGARARQRQFGRWRWLLASLTMSPMILSFRFRGLYS